LSSGDQRDSPFQKSETLSCNHMLNHLGQERGRKSHISLLLRTTPHGAIRVSWPFTTPVLISGRQPEEFLSERPRGERELGGGVNESNVPEYSSALGVESLTREKKNRRRWDSKRRLAMSECFYYSSLSTRKGGLERRSWGERKKPDA